MITALITLGEGYHNFHHEFPMDYRNGYKWHQLDPTKWFIWLCAKVGLASHLKVGLPTRLITDGLTRIQRFPENEIHKGMLTMELKHLRKKQEGLVWPQGGLPVVDWTTCTCFLSHFLLCLHFLPLQQINLRLDHVRSCASLDSSTIWKVSWVITLEVNLFFANILAKMQRRHSSVACTITATQPTMSVSVLPLLYMLTSPPSPVTCDETCRDSPWWYTPHHGGEIHPTQSNIAGDSRR